MMNYMKFLIASFTLNVIANAEPIEGNAVKRLECALKIRNYTDCPVNGGWSPWGPWENCRGDCGQEGYKLRERSCSNPKPVHGGTNCHGKQRQIRQCELPGCNMADYARLVNGDPLRKSQLELVISVHDRFPALGEKCLQQNCNRDLVASVLHEGATAYWNSLLCVKHNVGCPVRGGWTPWDAWSPCSAICGEGKKYRRRSCANPKPTSADLGCSGIQFESKPCTGVACAELLDGTWYVWTKWSKCSESCGIGIRKRERKCETNRKKRETISALDLAHERLNGSGRELAKKVVQAVDAENRCSGPSLEIEECNNKECDSDGGWSAWTGWSPCSARCDLGIQSRHRSCSSPPAQGIGNPCPGDVTEMRHCFQEPCIVKTHEVALFNGDSSLLYSSFGIPTMLLHMYIRFLHLEPHGRLISRVEIDCKESSKYCDTVNLDLQGNYLVWQASVSGCRAIAHSEMTLSIDEWHEALLTINGLMITMRVDDATDPLVGRFNCMPVKPDLDHAMIVGEQFCGKIQEIDVNFRQIHLKRESSGGNKSYPIGTVPYSTSNVRFEADDSNVEEGFRQFADGDLIAAPCPQDSDKWEVEIAVKLESTHGLLLLLPGEDFTSYIEVVLKLGRVNLKSHDDDDQSIVEAPVDLEPGQWLHVVINRAGVVVDGKCAVSPCNVGMMVNGGDRISLPPTEADESEYGLGCRGELFIGDIPDAHKRGREKRESEKQYPPLSGTLGFLRIDGKVQDIESLPATEGLGHKLASHTISKADYYIERPFSLGKQIGLSCFYDRDPLPPDNSNSSASTWLHLDTVIEDTQGEEVKDGDTAEVHGEYEVKDDGMITHLIIHSYPSREVVEGFYECWVEKGGNTKVLIAFGVPIIDPDRGIFDIALAMLILGLLSLLALLLYLLLLCCWFWCSVKPSECHCGDQNVSNGNIEKYVPPPVPAQVQCDCGNWKQGYNCRTVYDTEPVNDSKELPECRQTSTDISTKTIWKTPQVYVNDTSVAGDSNSSEPALPAVPIAADSVISLEVEKPKRYQRSHRREVFLKINGLVGGWTYPIVSINEQEGLYVSKSPMKRNQIYATQHTGNDRHVRLPDLEHKDQNSVQREKVGNISSPIERMHAVQHTEKIATPRLMTSDRNDKVQRGTAGEANSRKSNKPEVDVLIERKESLWRYRSGGDNDCGRYQSIPEVDTRYSYKNSIAESARGGCSDPPKCYTRHWDPTSGLYVIAELDTQSLDGKIIETYDGRCKDNQTMEYLMNVDRLCRDAINNNASDGCCSQY